MPRYFSKLLLSLIFISLPVASIAEKQVKRRKDRRMGAYEERSHENWSGTTKFTPRKVFYPKKYDEVVAIIKDASQRNIPIRAIGTAHSWGDLISTEGYLINTDAFNRILSVDYSSGRVHVEGGIKLKNLYKQIAAEGLALPTQGFIAEQSIAGATATGTHGSGHLGSISDCIVGMKIIDANGKLRSITQEENPELLQVARINLGALGFVYSITLQCVPLFVLEHKRTMMPWTTLMPNLMDMWNRNDFMVIMYHPLTPNALVYEWKRTDLPPTDNDRINLAEKIFFNKYMNYLSIQAVHYLPGLTNKFMDFVFKNLQQPSHREYSYITLSPLTCPQPVTNYMEAEIGIPIENFPQAFNETQSLYAQYKNRGMELVSTMLCRFAKGTTKSMLSMNYGRDTAYMTIATLDHVPGYGQFITDWELLMLKYKGRPHWGKINCMNKDFVKMVWGADSINRFNQLRKTLDPNGIFSNNYIKKCFD